MKPEALQDPVLPQLAIALDPRAMADVFATALRPHGGLRLRACRVDRVKYRPRRNCSVSYILALDDEHHGRAFEQRIAARFSSAVEAERRHASAATLPTTDSRAGPALLHVRGLGMLAHWLPNDARLAAVAHFFDDARLRGEWLPEVVAALTGGQGRLLDQTTTLLQYVPEHRACARVELLLQPAPGEAAVTRTVYAKADADVCGAETHAVMRALSCSPAQRDGRLRTPRSLLWQAASGLHWQEALAGRALLDLAPQVDATMSARVGAQLAALHETPSKKGIRHAHIERRPREVAEMLGLVEPRWQPTLAHLVDALRASARALAMAPTVTLHGDLHPRNILVDDGRVALIDLDTARLGPAAIDLGSWIADALYRAVLDGLKPATVAPAWRAFIAAYGEASGRAAPAMPLLAWSTAYHLLCERAYRAVANLKPGRWEGVPMLLALAERIAQSATLDAVVSIERVAA